MVSLEILNYDFHLFKNVTRWLALVKTMNQFDEANKGLEEWKGILREFFYFFFIFFIFLSLNLELMDNYL